MAMASSVERSSSPSSTSFSVKHGAALLTALLARYRKPGAPASSLAMAPQQQAQHEPMHACPPDTSPCFSAYTRTEHQRHNPVIQNRSM